MSVESVTDFKSIFFNGSHTYDFYLLPNVHDIGIINSEQAFENLIVLQERAKEAAKNNAYIEYTSLLLQYMDLFLRMYIVSKKGDGAKITNKPQFGQLLSECEKLGFNAGLLSELRVFNNTRKEIIHNFLLGGIKPDDLNNLIHHYFGFGMKIKDYIIRSIGVKINSHEELPEDVGAMVFQLRKIKN